MKREPAYPFLCSLLSSESYWTYRTYVLLLIVIGEVRGVQRLRVCGPCDRLTYGGAPDVEDTEFSVGFGNGFDASEFGAVVGCELCETL